MLFAVWCLATCKAPSLIKILFILIWIFGEGLILYSKALVSVALPIASGEAFSVVVPISKLNLFLYLYDRALNALEKQKLEL